MHLIQNHLQRILDKVLKYKLIFIETPDAAETSIALENYRIVERRGGDASAFSIRTIISYATGL